MNTSPQQRPEFYFELSANGEQTTFTEVEGMVTDVALRNNLQAGDNPFKFRLPSIPKGQHLVLKNGKASQNSKLGQWCAEANNPEVQTPKNKATLRLKDAQGNALVEWDLHSAHPIHSKTAPPTTKDAPQQWEQVDLAYSFFTLHKK